MSLTKSNFYKKETRKPITLETSWDDGGILDMRVADLLEKYKLQGTFYVVCDWVGKEGYLTWDNIKDLDSRGFKIGSHTTSHPMDMKMLYEDDLFAEINVSKDIIENVIGHSIDTFAYPRGRTDDRIKEMVARADYITARGTGKPGITTSDDKYYLPGTIHIFQRPEYEGVSIEDYSRKVFDKLNKEGGYCNIFGHSAEVDKNNLWGTLETVLSEARFLLDGYGKNI